MAEMTPNSDLMAKVAAARDAIDLAAADLLAHAEGLATLAMMARWREEHSELAEKEAMEIAQAGDGLRAFIRNRASEDAHWRMIRAAAELAGAKEAHLQATIMPSVILRGLREAVEDIVGPYPSPPPPPPVAKIAEVMSDRHPGVRPEAVHRQGWLNYLMASTAKPRGAA